ncbi:MAG: HAMP domain-containing sensor histidine kinase [Blastocatellia bacterium]
MAVRLEQKVLLARWLVAVPAVAVALAGTMLVAPYVQVDVSAVFLAAVMFSAWKGGLGAGMLATALSSIVRAFFFLPPAYSFTLDASGVEELAVFGFAALVISSLSAAREEATAREQAARVEAENANAVKDEFLAAVSHELRTPLTTIKTLTRILQRDDTTDDERREYLGDVAIECDRQIDLISNLLDVSRIRAGVVTVTPRSVDAGKVLRDCGRAQSVGASERGHEISVDIEDGLQDVCADRDALRRAISSIVENAIKYTSDGGRIVLRAHRDDAAHITLEVADNGRGIRAEDLPHVFERFYRGIPDSGPDWILGGEIPGIGLGLYLAGVLVRGMGGEIHVSSTEGKGSTFTVRLPVWRDDVDLQVNEIPHETAVEHLQKHGGRRNDGETSAGR